jgi:hypothetical protein
MPFPDDFNDVNASWIATNAVSFQTINNLTLSPIIPTPTTGFDLPIFSAMGTFSNNPNFLVSSIQMYINVNSPVIEFFAGANPTPIHTISNTGRYTGTRLQTFDVPHVNMATVTSVRIRSTSSIEPNITWYGLQITNNNNGSSGYVFTGNFTSDSVPLTIFDNATELTSNNELNTSLATVPTVPQMPSFSIQPNREYNFNPFYLIIPTIGFTGAGASTSTTVPFSLQLTENNVVVTTVTFNLNTGLSYANGIVIPLTNDSSLVPASVTNIVHTVTPLNVTNPAYLRGTQSIGGRLSWTQGVVNLNMIIRINDSSGLGVRIFGTGVTLHPLFTPNSKDIRSPITFSPNKMITFPNILTATDRIASNTMSYAIINQPTPPVVTLLAPTNLTQSFSLLNAFNQNNATITVIAQSSDARGLHARSIFSQPSIFNYQNLTSDRVPFVNTYNAAPITITDNGNNPALAVMNVTFTRNVVLSSLDFGYVFERFLPTSNITNAGYAATNIAVSGTATFTITLTSIPRIAGEPSITYGRVQFVCRPNQSSPTNAYRAMHTSTDNQTGANDGTLLSIPFTTTALTPLPTFVDSFTPSVAESNFTFNVGDQVRIEFAFNQIGAQYITTPVESTQFAGILQQQPEMCGALVCTPNTAGNSNPTNVWFSNSAATITANTDQVQTESFTFNAPTILHGFRLASFRLNGVTAAMRLRVNVFRNNINTFQVYFNYIDPRFSGTPAPLFIPFSYAEFDRYAGIAANANDVVRIDPTTIVFSRPQHPIFNLNDTFRMEIAVMTATTPGVQSALSVQNIIYAGNGSTNTIGGRLSGIILSTPTITFPTSISTTQLTPVFVVLGPRNIPISIPTSNSTGAITYTVTSQSVNPPTATAVSLSTIANNAFTAQLASSIHSRILINAWQRSSTIFTNGSATSTIDYINTSQTFRAYSTSPSVIASLQQIQMINNPRPFIACITETSATLHGFSFQFFGGYQGGFNYAMIVWVTRGNVRQTPELQITFTTGKDTINNPNASADVLDGTFAYIPFQPNVIQTPTHVSNIVYSGSLPTVQLGDFVRVYMWGATSTNPTAPTAGIQSTPLQQTSGNNVAGPMLGSLLIDVISTQPIQVVNNGSNTIIIEAGSQNNAFVANITNATPLSLMFIRMPYIEIWNTGVPTMQSPYRIMVSIFVADGITSIYTCEIVMCITAGVTSGFIDIPFNMPRPTDPRSADGDPSNRYYIESFNPRFNPDYFGINTNIDVGTATHSFPRIFRGPVPSSQSYSYVINVTNMQGFGQIRIVDTTASIAGAPLGTNVTCQLGYINNLPS